MRQNYKKYGSFIGFDFTFHLIQDKHESEKNWRVECFMDQQFQKVSSVWTCLFQYNKQKQDTFKYWSLSLKSWKNNLKSSEKRICYFNQIYIIHLKPGKKCLIKLAILSWLFFFHRLLGFQLHLNDLTSLWNFLHVLDHLDLEVFLIIIYLKQKCHINLKWKDWLLLIQFFFPFLLKFNSFFGIWQKWTP